MEVKQLIAVLTALSGVESVEAQEQAQPASPMVGKPVIVRCRDAGVHFGYLVGHEGREVTLSKSRRMYYWKASKGHTLSGCALHGITSESKIAGALDSITLLDACEIIPCESGAAASIGGADEHNV